jgi:hypothetical protein
MVLYTYTMHNSLSKPQWRPPRNTRAERVNSQAPSFCRWGIANSKQYAKSLSRDRAAVAWY